jgi:hypothetical protein
VRFRQVVDFGLPTVPETWWPPQDLDIVVPQDGFDFYGHSWFWACFRRAAIETRFGQLCCTAVVIGEAGRGGSPRSITSRSITVVMST